MSDIVVSGGTTNVNAVDGTNTYEVENTGILNIQAAGLISGQVNVSNGGSLDIQSGGGADAVTVSSGGTETVFGVDPVTGGVTFVDTGGFLIISAGGSTTGGAPIGSGFLGGTAVEGGTVEVLSGGTFSWATVFAGSANVSAGGTLHDVTVSNGGTLNVAGTVTSDVLVTTGGIENVLSGGVVTGAINFGTLVSGGTVNVSSGGTFNFSEEIAGGITNLSAGATADVILVSGGGTFNVAGTVTSDNSVFAGGIENVLSGGLITGVTGSGTGIAGTVNVLAGGSADHISVSSGGRLNVAGTVLSNVKVLAGGIENVLSGGVVSGAVGAGTAVSGGTVNVSSGGTFTFVTEFAGGITNLSAGATAHDNAVSSGGTFNVAGTVASNGFVFTGGIENVLSGGVVTGDPADGTLVSGGTVNVRSGGTFSFSEDIAGGITNLSAGATAHDLAVSSGGTLNVAGTVTSNDFVFSGGIENVLSGGVVTGDPADGTAVSGGTVNVRSGGTLNFVTEFGGITNVSAGGTAHDITVSSGGTLNVAGTITSNVLVATGGLETVSSGGLTSGIVNVNGTSISGGQVDVLSGGTFGFALIMSGGNLNVSGGVALEFTASGGGIVNVSSGGVAHDFAISSGGTVNVLSGGVAHDFTISSGGTVNVAGTVTSNTLVTTGGTEDVLAGGVVSGATNSGTLVSGGTVDVASGGTFSIAEDIAGGITNLSAGARAHDISVSGGGTLNVAGTVTSDVIVTGGGTENVLAGGVVSGVINSGTLVSGGTVDVAAGGTFSFSTDIAGGITNLSAGATAHDLAVSSGGTLNVAGTVTSDVLVTISGIENVLSGGTTNGTTIAGGFVELDSGGTASGGLTFSGSGGTLKIDGTSMPTATISGFASGDVIDLAGSTFTSGGSVQLVSGNILDVVENSVTYALQFAPGTFDGQFKVSQDGAGTDITLGATPTVTVTSDLSATHGQTINLSSLVTILDPDNVGYQELQLWDTNGTAATGEFMVNNVALPAGQWVNVSPANVANTVFDVGTLGGSDTLYARLLENNGTLPASKSFTVTAPAATLPTVTVTSVSNAMRGQVINLSSLVTILDPDNVGYQDLQLWDTNGTAATGEFMVNNVALPAGQWVNVSPANVANAVFDVGILGGSDTLYARLLEDNGTLPASKSFTVTAPAATLPTVTVTSVSNATHGQTINLSSLVTILDPDNVGYQELQLWDTNGTAATGEFMVNNVALPAGQWVNVSPANVANTVFDVGTLGGSDTLYARLLENNGTLPASKSFTVTAPAPTLPTVTVTSDLSAMRGQVISLSSLVTILDPDNVGYQELQLWDTNGTAATGEFMVNNVALPAGQWVNVSPANVANAVFDVGILGGSDTLYARLLENNGTLPASKSFTVTAPAATLPTVTVTSVSNAMRGQVINLSSLVTILDPDNVGYQDLQLWDTNGTAATGEFMVNNVALPAGQWVNVSPANVANAVFDVGTLGGSDTLYARLLEDNGTLPASKSFTVTAPAATLPTVTVTSVSNATHGQTINLSSLVTILDPDNVGYQELQLWDTNGTAATGEFMVNNVALPAGQWVNVSPANVANTVFDVGTLGGSDTLYARLLENNGTLPASKSFTVTAPAPTLPTVTVTSDLSAMRGQVISLSSLVTILDPDNVGYQELQLWDTNGTAATGEFMVNNVALPAGQWVNVSPANVANTVFDVGTLGGSDTLYARLLEDNGTLPASKSFTVTAPAATLPTVTVTSVSNATPSEVISLSSLVTILDPDNVGYQELQLWDTNGTAATGEFMVNNVALPAGQWVNVSPANVANTVFDVGTTGASDTLYARLLEDNGTLPASKSFTVVDPVTVAQGATVELSAPYAGHAIFAGTAGTLQLDNSTGFTGTVAGMTGQDMLDLRDINFASIQNPVFSGTSSGGTLTVSAGTHTASIALLGNYMASTFVASSDGNHGTSVVEQPANQASVLSLPQHA